MEQVVTLTYFWKTCSYLKREMAFSGPRLLLEKAYSPFSFLLLLLGVECLRKGGGRPKKDAGADAGPRISPARKAKGRGGGPPGEPGCPSRGQQSPPGWQGSALCAECQGQILLLSATRSGTSRGCGGGQGSAGLSYSVGEVTGVCTQQEPQPVSATRTRLGPHRPL